MQRDDVRIASAGEGVIAAPPGGGISVSPGYNATFDNITLTGGDLWVQPGATVWLEYSVVQGNLSPVGNGLGVWVQGGTLRVQNSVITGNEIGVLAQGGGQVFAFSTDFTGNTNTGADMGSNSLLSADDSSFSANGNGVALSGNSVLTAGNSSFTANGNVGVAVGTGSHASLYAGRVEGNGGDGIMVVGASTAQVGSVLIQDNGGDGIYAADFSTVEGGTFEDPTQILNNGEYGFRCEGDPAIAQEQNSIEASIVSGNTLGDTNCPAP